MNLRSTLPSLSTPNNTPQLCLLQQTSLGEETVSQNGLVRSVHVLVKNTPFQLVIGFTNAQNVNHNFNRLALDVSLLYDCDGFKPVSYIKTKPVTYKPKFSDNGDQVTFNCRLKVLTSQHEDMFFRVKVRALQPVTQQEFNPPLEVISHPIKVVSKPEQLKGRKKSSSSGSSSRNSAGSSNSNEESMSCSPPTSSSMKYTEPASSKGPSMHSFSSPSTASTFSNTTSNSSSKRKEQSSSGTKRDLTDMLVETVNRLERQQQLHQKLLQQICDPNNNLALTLGINQDLLVKLQEDSAPDTCEPVSKKRRIEDVVVLPDALNQDEGSSSTSTTASSNNDATPRVQAKERCEDIFVRFLESYTALAPEDRSLVVRRIVRGRSSKETEQLVELVDLFSSEGLQRSIGSGIEEGMLIGGAPHMPGVGGECGCVSCPHRKELEKIDEFYSNFFSG